MKGPPQRLTTAEKPVEARTAHSGEMVVRVRVLRFFWGPLIFCSTLPCQGMTTPVDLGTWTRDGCGQNGVGEWKVCGWGRSELQH